MLSDGLHYLGRQLNRLARACDFAAVGLLSASDLERRRGQLWDQFGLTADHVANGLFGWERSFYLPRLHPASRILVVGCGSGREMLALLELGHEVVGLDPAPRPTAFAREQLVARGHPSRVHTATLDAFESGDRFDLVIFSWFTYAYILGSEARVRALTRSEQLLSDGGSVVISLPAWPATTRMWPLMRLMARLSRNDWNPEPGDMISLLDGGGASFFHGFAPGEVAAEAERARLRIADRRESDSMTLLALVRARDQTRPT
jgi:SAM-dependent methyltransferase